MIRPSAILLLLTVLAMAMPCRPAFASDEIGVGGHLKRTLFQSDFSARQLSSLNDLRPQFPTTAPLMWRTLLASEAQPAQSAGPNWIKRHPALFGALAGAGGGALFAMLSETELFCSGGDEDCLFYGAKRPLVGAVLGAGIGSLIGFAIK
jgi:hypothetical protein